MKHHFPRGLDITLLTACSACRCFVTNGHAVESKISILFLMKIFFLVQLSVRGAHNMPEVAGPNLGNKVC
jgi:hypothetical protein